MKCTYCGLEMKQLLTSWYCPSCEGGDNSDVKEIPDSSREVEWELVGTIGYIHSHPYGYIIYYSTNAHTIHSSLFIYDTLDYKSNLYAEKLAKHDKKGFTLYRYSIDKKYGIWSPGWYWENGVWKYDEHK